MSRYVEILATLQKSNPSIQFYRTPGKDAIGYWNHTLGRCQVLVAELIDGNWARMPDLEINGEPAIRYSDWEPA